MHSFLPSTHGLIVKFSALFLKLVVTDIKCVSSKTMITNFYLVLTSSKMVNHIIILVIIISSIMAFNDVSKAIVSLLVPVSIRITILVCILLILLHNCHILVCILQFYVLTHILEINIFRVGSG